MGLRGMWRRERARATCCWKWTGQLGEDEGEGGGRSRGGAGKHGPAYADTGLPYCRHCHSGPSRHHRWTRAPRRLVSGGVACHCPSGLPSSSSCAGGRRARTPRPASDTLHLQTGQQSTALLASHPLSPVPHPLGAHQRWQRSHSSVPTRTGKASRGVADRQDGTGLLVVSTRLWPGP